MNLILPPIKITILRNLLQSPGYSKIDNFLSNGSASLSLVATAGLNEQSDAKS